MRVLSLLVGWCLAVAILCAAPGARPAPVAAASCPSGRVTMQDLMDLYEDRGRLANRFPQAVAWINERARECFGAKRLRLEAFVNDPGGIGGTTAYSVTPRWFLASSLIVFTSAAESSIGIGEGPFYGFAVPPSLGDVQARYARSWVWLTIHFMDWRAPTCRASGVEGETPTTRQAIRICESVAVVESIGRPGEVPDSATAPATEDAALPGISVDLRAWAILFGSVLVLFSLLGGPTRRPWESKRPGR